MKRLIVLVACLAALGACDDTRHPVAPDEETSERPSLAHAAEAGPPDGFPVVIVRERPGASGAAGHGPIVDDIADALARVRAGGTIKVHPGTYTVHHPLIVDEPVTIEGTGGTPLIVADGAPVAFLVNADGNTTIRGLRFEGAPQGAVLVSEFGVADPYDEVVMEDLHVEAPDGFTSGISVWPGVHPPDGRRAVLRNSTIVGGWRGTHIHEDVPQFDAIGNTLIDQNTAGSSSLAYSRGASGRMEGNVLIGCQSCINVGGGDRTSGEYEIIDNEMRIDIDGPTGNVLAVSGLSAEVVGNVIEGVGGTHDPDDPSTWPIRSNAILVETTENAVLRGNTVSGAWWAFGIGWDVGTVEGRDNVAHDVRSAFVNHPADGTIVFRFNDFSDYTGAIELGTVGDLPDLTCNWWGAATGPQGALPDPAVYTPWATAPIAGTGATSCDGGL